MSNDNDTPPAGPSPLQAAIDRIREADQVARQSSLAYASGNFAAYLAAEASEAAKRIEDEYDGPVLANDGESDQPEAGDSKG